MDERLKQRLVGATVVVALMVIVVPILLDGSGRRAQDEAKFEIPPRPEFPQRPLEKLSKLQPVPKPAEALAKQSADSQSNAKQVPQAWVIQMGAFSSQANAVVLRDKLRSSGYPAFVEALRDKPQFRVRVGPEVDKAVANELRDKLAQEYGQKGIVVRYP